MSTRLKQILIVLVGAVVALVMVFLGLWQMQVFVERGNRTVADRASQAPVPLAEHLGSDGAVGDIYGKQVTITGRYTDRQLLVPTEGSYRVLASFEVSDGRVLPVVRGLVGDPVAPPPAPAGERTEVGLFLPGEADAAPAPAGMIGSVRMPLLAQLWPDQLVPGFVTLSAADASSHGLAQAPVSLPEGEGSARNSGYALQWWVFAAFGLGMCIKIAHSLGVRERRKQELALRGGEELSRKDSRP